MVGRGVLGFFLVLFCFEILFNWERGGELGLLRCLLCAQALCPLLPQRQWPSPSAAGLGSACVETGRALSLVSPVSDAVVWHTVGPSVRLLRGHTYYMRSLI